MLIMTTSPTGIKQCQKRLFAKYPITVFSYQFVLDLVLLPAKAYLYIAHEIAAMATHVDKTFW